MITVTITMVDGSMVVYENVHRAGPDGSFFLVGLEDRTIVIPESQVKTICTTEKKPNVTAQRGNGEWVLD